MRSSHHSAAAAADPTNHTNKVNTNKNDDQVVGTIPDDTVPTGIDRDPNHKQGDDQQDDHEQSQQMQELLNLVLARASGNATNDEVEIAVERILGKANTTTPIETTIMTTESVAFVPTPTGKTRNTVSELTVNRDMDNYDDDDDDDNNNEENQDMSTNANQNYPLSKDTYGNPPTNTTGTIEPQRKRRRPRWNAPRSITPQMVVWDQTKWSSLYADIPLGLAGAHMIITFGGCNPIIGSSNPKDDNAGGEDRNVLSPEPPLPDTVREVLAGARQLLHVAVRDARCLRRQRQRTFREAQAVLRGKSHGAASPWKNATSTTTTTTTTDAPDAAVIANRTTGQSGGRKRSASLHLRETLNEWSPDVLYRVHAGYDPIAYSPKCGFDMEDLQQLYPEEMHAYLRWNKSYRECDSQMDPATNTVTGNPDKKSSNDTVSANLNDEVDDDDDNSNGEDHDSDRDNNDGNDRVRKGLPTDSTQDSVFIEVGHLKQRAAQFDVRTVKMKDDTYLQFAEVRKGSFLPRHRKYANETDPLMNDDAEEKSWARLPLVAIRFLHWVGFDPDSSLPPPNEETTHALAFLAYDFVGRIVEKAVQLKLEAIREDDDILELKPGQQLEPTDITRAMQDPTIRPVPLCGVANRNGGDAPAPQLYFGPGFEHRLEMELEEFVKRQQLADETDLLLTYQEDLDVLREEEELFRRLAAQPRGGVSIDAISGTPEDRVQEAEERQPVEACSSNVQRRRKNE